jgi:hypothetical protein
MQKLGVALLVVLPLSFLAFSQTVTASAQSSTTTPSGPASHQTSPPIITLGNSAVALTGISAAMLVAVLVGAIRSQAGHISPYRNGEELDLEGSLPLGITDDVDYPPRPSPSHPATASPSSPTVSPKPPTPPANSSASTAPATSATNRQPSSWTTC